MWNPQKNTAKERVAAQLRLCEKQILTNTMAALRARLAPIRGIPTKGGGLKVHNPHLFPHFTLEVEGLWALKVLLAENAEIGHFNVY
jgi:hypothetical protein